jgi:hypothetical protein
MQSKTILHNIVNGIDIGELIAIMISLRRLHERANEEVHQMCSLYESAPNVDLV